LSQPSVCGNGGTSNGTIIDDVRIYSRALSATEVQQLYNSTSGNKNDVSLAGGSTSAAGKGLAAGLIGWWTFDGKNMVSNVKDSSGQGNNGTLVNFGATSTAIVTGKAGQALKFNGTNSYVSIAAPSTLDFLSTNKYTWSAWVNYKSIGNGLIQCYLSKDPVSPPKDSGFNLCLTQTANTADLQVCVAGGSTTCASGLTLNLPSGQWEHLVVVYDGASNWKIYVNGIYKGTEVLTVTSETFANYFIGAGQKNATQFQTPDLYFKGMIDDVRVYNRALSATEVQQLYNSNAGNKNDVSLAGGSTNGGGQGLAAGLVGWWTFDGKNLVNNVADSSGQGNNGNMVGFGATSSAVVTGKVGQALNFNGSSNLVRIDSIANKIGTGDVTFSAWYKVNKAPSTDLEEDDIINLGDAPSNNDIRLLATYQNSAPSPHTYFEYLIHTSSGWYASSPAYVTPIKQNMWYFLTGTLSVSSGAKLYLNGNLVSSVSVVTTRGATQSLLAAIGGFSGGNFYANGSIDDVRIYNRVLSATEVKQLYNMGK
jgi:hypothetical protein